MFRVFKCLVFVVVSVIFSKVWGLVYRCWWGDSFFLGSMVGILVWFRGDLLFLELDGL